MSEQKRRYEDDKTWIEKNWAILSFVICSAVTIIVLFTRVESKVEAHEPRICNLEKKCEILPAIDAKIDMILKAQERFDKKLDRR